MWVRIDGHFGDLQLMVRPLVAFRDYHSTTHENAGLNARLELAEGQASFSPMILCPDSTLGTMRWLSKSKDPGIRNFEYEEERKRGLDLHEDLYNPCRVTL